MPTSIHSDSKRFTLRSMLILIGLTSIVMAVVASGDVTVSSDSAAESSDSVQNESPLRSSNTRDTLDPSVVHCANLVYGRGKTSVCFSDDFLEQAEKASHIRTSGQFVPVEMEDESLFVHPFAVMTGEGRFRLSEAQRRNLRDYVLAGGFVVASAGCSNYLWNQSFRDEMALAFPEHKLTKLDMDHPVFHTVYDINHLLSKRAGSNPMLEALIIDGRIGLIYSPDGLNDTANAGANCCCCGGNEVRNARQVNVNLLAYALTH